MKLFCNEEVIKMLSNKSKEFASKKKKRKEFLGVIEKFAFLIVVKVSQHMYLPKLINYY